MSHPRHHAPTRDALPANERDLEAAAAAGGVRWALIRRVRRELAQGTYLTPQRWEGAVDRLLRAVQAG